MSDLNQCAFVGRLGQDPEITVTPTGRKKAKFSIAVSDKWTDESGIKHEKTTWVPITAWNRLANTVESYLHKGSQVLVQGKLGFSTYTDKNGIERTSTTVTMDFMQMLGSRQQGHQRQEYRESSDNTPTATRPRPANMQGSVHQPMPAYTTAQTATTQKAMADDDMPF